MAPMGNNTSTSTAVAPAPDYNNLEAALRRDLALPAPVPVPVPQPVPVQATGNPEPQALDHDLPPAPVKRKADEFDIDFDRYDEDDISCDMIRSQIRKFISDQAGAWKVCEYRTAVGASPSGHSAFMRDTGDFRGICYQNSLNFFKNRHLFGEAPRPPRKLRSGTYAIEDPKYDVWGIHLEGDDGGHNVEVYDTCDSCRIRIREHLSLKGITQALFCKQMSSSFHHSEMIGIRQLQDFMLRQGPHAGNSSPVFYGAFVYFEKLRIKNNEQKSDFRMKMEEIYKEKKGFDTKTPNQEFFVGVGKSTPLDSSFLC